MTLDPDRRKALRARYRDMRAGHVADARATDELKRRHPEEWRKLREQHMARALAEIDAASRTPS